MSHTATVRTQFRSPQAIQKAAKALGIPCQIGTFTESFFDGKKHTGNVKLNLPGWQYPVLFDTKTGEAKFDNYNGHWGKIEELNKVMQEYSLQVAEAEAQEFTLQGWTISRQKQANGDIQLVIEQ